MDPLSRAPGTTLMRKPEVLLPLEYVDVASTFCKAILKCYPSRLDELLFAPDPEICYGFQVDWILILSGGELDEAVIIHFTYNNGVKLMEAFDDGIRDAQKLRLAELSNDEDDEDVVFSGGGTRLSKPIYKPRVHLRPSHGLSSSYIRASLPRSFEYGFLVTFEGTIIRTGQIKMVEYKREMECVKCHRRFELTADFEQFNSFPKPTSCPVGRDSDPPCAGKNFKLVTEEGESTVMVDFQEVKVQEHIQKLGVGSIPRSMPIVLLDDLVDSCKAGDDIVCTGVVLRRWKPLIEGERMDLEAFVLGIHVHVKNDQTIRPPSRKSENGVKEDTEGGGVAEEGRKAGNEEDEKMRREFEEFWKKHREEGRELEARNHILKSMCPQIFGMFNVKLSVVLVIIGGVPKLEGDMKVRGQCHLLLVGEPGTGKSQILKFASKLGPRCVLTTGVGTTGAGLTVTAVKEPGGEWVLEAGALVLADGGLCCIDEFDSVKPQDRATIHEAMEQQTLSVAKAGLVCKLNTRTTVIAATNTKANFDPSQSISVNTALASPLLSRFDLILCLLDKKNKDWDQTVARFILNESIKYVPPSVPPPAGFPLNRSAQNNGIINSASDVTLQLQAVTGEKRKKESPDGVWSLEKLHAYMNVVKGFEPLLSEESERILSRYYQTQRQSDTKNSARTTIRLLESLIRLSQAHARLMFREIVEVQDAVQVVALMEGSMLATGLINSVSPLHTHFPEDPEAEYREVEHTILRRLGLEDILEGVEQGLAIRPHPASRTQSSTRASEGEEETESRDDNLLYHSPSRDSPPPGSSQPPKSRSPTRPYSQLPVSPPRSQQSSQHSQYSQEHFHNSRNNSSSSQSQRNSNKRLRPGPNNATLTVLSGRSRDDEGLTPTPVSTNRSSQTGRPVNTTARSRQLLPQDLLNRGKGNGKEPDEGEDEEEHASLEINPHALTLTTTSSDSDPRIPPQRTGILRTSPPKRRRGEGEGGEDIESQTRANKQLRFDYSVPSSHLQHSSKSPTKPGLASKDSKPSHNIASMLKKRVPSSASTTTSSTSSSSSSVPSSASASVLLEEDDEFYLTDEILEMEKTLNQLPSAAVTYTGPNKVSSPSSTLPSKPVQINVTSTVLSAPSPASPLASDGLSMLPLRQATPPGSKTRRLPPNENKEEEEEDHDVFDELMEMEKTLEGGIKPTLPVSSPSFASSKPPNQNSVLQALLMEDDDLLDLPLAIPTQKEITTPSISTKVSSISTASLPLASSIPSSFTSSSVVLGDEDLLAELGLLDEPPATVKMDTSDLTKTKPPPSQPSASTVGGLPLRKKKRFLD